MKRGRIVLTIEYFLIIVLESKITISLFLPLSKSVCVFCLCLSSFTDSLDSDSKCICCKFFFNSWNLSVVNLWFFCFCLTLNKLNATVSVFQDQYYWNVSTGFSFTHSVASKHNIIVNSSLYFRKSILYNINIKN